MRGSSVSRGAVAFVTQGLIYSGQSLVPGVTAEELAASWLANVKSLCANARMTISPADEEQLEDWIVGSLPTR